ncbi:hypothetical protein [Enterococcus sp.]|uniref:hypothetical protein n=1 Tax=Enterococcus sp. TaxID=35783 RepID=UPI003C739E2D
MIIRQATFSKSLTTITQTDNQVSVKLRDMEYIYIPTDKTRLDEIFDEMVMLEGEFHG